MCQEHCSLNSGRGRGQPFASLGIWSFTFMISRNSRKYRNHRNQKTFLCWMKTKTKTLTCAWHGAMGAKIQKSFEHNSPWSGTEDPLYKDKPSKLRLSFKEHFNCGRGMKKTRQKGLHKPLLSDCYYCIACFFLLFPAFIAVKTKLLLRTTATVLFC